MNDIAHRPKARLFAGLRTRLLLLVLLAMLPLAALLVYDAAREREAALAAAKIELQSLVQLAAEDLENRIAGARHMLQAATAVAAVRDATVPACADFLAGMLQQAQRYNNLIVIGADGKLLCSAIPPGRAVNYGDTDYVRRAIESHRPAVGKPTVARITGRAVLPVAWPILDAAGRADKVVAVGLRLDWFGERYARAGFLPRRSMLIWDAEGRVLYRYPDAEKLTGTLHAETPLITAAQRAQGTDVVETPGLDGIVRAYAFSSVPALSDLGLTLAAGVPRTELVAAADANLRLNLTVLALLVGAVFAFAWWAAEVSIRGPVTRLAAASGRLRAGDLKARIPAPHPGGEIGALMAGFNEAAAAVETQSENLQRSNRALEMLSACNQALMRASSEAQLLDHVCALIVEHGGYRFAWVGFAGPDQAGDVRPVARAGIEEDELRRMRLGVSDAESTCDFAGTAIRTGQWCVARDIPNDPACSSRREAAIAHGFAASIALPLKFNGAAGGALNLYAADPEAFDQKEIALLTQLADDLAYGIGALRGRAARKRAEQEICTLNAELEQRVADRTAQLQAANTELQAEIAERKRAQAELAAQTHLIAIKNAELEEADAMKSRFLANMSHELRTPLNAIIGFSELLKDGMAGDLTDKQKGFMVDIYASGEHLLALINDILDLSKVEAGMMKLEPELVDIAHLFQASLMVVKEKAMAHRLRLALDVQPGLPPFAADPRRVKQIVYNLLANAVKFTPDGGTITLAARRVPHAGVRLPAAVAGLMLPLSAQEGDEYCEISVADSGIGIEAADMEKLFRPFVQIDSSLARQYQGTGLGLTMVKNLAELHGGTVAVASEPARGSRFYVWLPLRAAPAPATPRATALPLVQRGPGKPLALLIEDDDNAARIIELQLESEGFQCMRAATGEEGLARAAKQLPQLITLDIFLPNIDGWEVLERLKANPELAGIPVVIISIAPGLEHGISLGATRVLHKPFARDDLVAALRDAGVKAQAEQPATVLVADDDPASVELLASHLAALGARVLRAYGGREAIDAAQNLAPDLILLDLMMPDVSGFEVVEALKSRPETAAIPILVITSKSLTAEDRAALNGHVTLIMQRAAFSGEAFIREVRRALQSAAGGRGGQIPGGSARR